MSQKKNDLGKGIRALLEGMNSDAEGDFLQKKEGAANGIHQ